MRFSIQLSDGRNLIGAIQGYGGECRTLERANGYLNSLRRRRNPHDVYLKIDFDPITGAHTRMVVHVNEIVTIEEEA